MTVPFAGLPLGEQRDWFLELADLGYTDVWSSEANGADAFTPLALASVVGARAAARHRHRPRLHPGPGLPGPVGRLAGAGRARAASCSASARRPTSSSSAGTASPSRSRTSGPATWCASCGTPLTGEKVREEYETFTVERLQARGARPPSPCPILVAALREGMLRLAGREGDGAIINWLSADDVTTGRARSSKAGGEDKEVVARIFVAVPTTPTPCGPPGASPSPPT